MLLSVWFEVGERERKRKRRGGGIEGENKYGNWKGRGKMKVLVMQCCW